MMTSKRLAGLLGPIAVAIAISEALNLRIWHDTPASLVYLAGTLLFIAGLAIVRVHNRWTAGWPVVVTLVGWFGIAGGLMRMMAPAFAQRQTEGNATAVYAFLIVVLGTGLFLTLKGYGRDMGTIAGPP